MIYNLTRPALNITVSSVKAGEESLSDYIAIKQFNSRLMNICSRELDVIIEPQAFLYNDDHVEDIISLLRTKLPDGVTVTNVMEKLTNVLDIAETHKDSISTVFETLKTVKNTTDNVAGAVDTSKTIVKSVAVASLVFYLIKFISEPTKIKALAVILISGALYGLGVLDDIPKIIDNIFVDCISPLIKMFFGDTAEEDGNNETDIDMEIVPQSSDFSTMAYDGIIFGFMTYMGVKSKLSFNELKKDSAFRTMADLLRLRNSFPEFLDSLFSYIKKLYNEHLADFLKMNRINIDNFDDPYLQLFENDVLSLREDLASGKFSLSVDNFAKVKFLHAKAKELYRDIPNIKERASDRQLFYKNIEILAKIRIQFETSNVHINGFRVEPVGVLLRGGAGTHKSTVMSAIAAACAASVLNDEEFEEYRKCPQNFEHNRQHENVYMDGYNPQTVSIMFDDLGQTKDVPGNPDTEWMNIVRFVNSFEAMGHAANMEQKGVLRIRPKFVLATTNLIRMSSNSINSMEAVVRRFPVSLVAVPRSDLCSNDSEGVYSRKFDYSKLPKVKTPNGDYTSDIQMEHFMFYKCNGNGEVKGDPISFEEVMDWIMSEHNMRVAWHATHMKNFEDVSAFYRNKYFKPSTEAQADNPFPQDEGIIFQRDPELHTIDFVGNMLRNSEQNTTPGVVPEPIPNPMWYIRERRKRRNWTHAQFHNAALEQTVTTPVAAVFNGLATEMEQEMHDFGRAYKVSAHTLDKVNLLSKYYTPEDNIFKQFSSSMFTNPETSVFGSWQEFNEFNEWSSDWKVLYDDIPEREIEDLMINPLDWAHLSYHGKIKVLYKLNKTLLQHFLVMRAMPSNSVPLQLPGWAQSYASGDVSCFTVLKRKFTDYLENVVKWSKEFTEYFSPYFSQAGTTFLIYLEAFGGTMTALVLGVAAMIALVLAADVFSGRTTLTKNSEYNMKAKELYKRNGISVPPSFTSDELDALLQASPTAKRDDPVFKGYVQTQSLSYDVSKSSHTTKNRTVSQMRNSIKLANNPSVVAQGNDISGFDIIESVTNKNLARCYVYRDDDDISPNFMGYALVLKKNKVLVPTHFYEKLYRGVIKDDDRYEYKFRMLPISDEDQVGWLGECSVRDFLENAHDDGLEDSHTIIVAIPTRDCRSIVKTFFVTEAQAANIMKLFQVTVAIPHRKTLVNSSAYKTVIPMSDGDVRYNVTKGIRYFVDTYVGDCGAPIYIRNAKLQAHRIIGIHIAGSSKSGDETAFAGLITQEAILSCLKMFKDDPVNVPEIFPEGTKMAELQSDSPFIADRFSLLCEVAQYHSPYGFSDIIKSRLQKPKGPFESNMRVAMLIPRNGIDPYKNALKNYCSNEAFIDKELLRFCTHDFMNVLFDGSYNNKRILTLEEALWGNPDLEFCDSMKSSTSAGYPMKYDLYNVKKILFDPRNSRDSSNPAFIECGNHVNEIIDNAKKGIRMLHVFTDCLKSERRKLAKVVEGLSRQFNGSPFYYFVTIRMYFGAFTAFIHSNSIKNSMVTSINPFSESWNTIAQDLSKFDLGNEPQVCDGDFAHFDGSMLTEFAEEILYIINKWYDDGNDEIRRILWMEVVNSRHIFGNIIYEWFASLVSGHPLTLIINCMTNLLAHRYCFYSAHPRTVKFHEVVVIKVTGDDVIMSVAQDYRHSFNGVVIEGLMRMLGYTYTSATKDDTIVPFKPLTEAQFLKRSFRFEPLLGQYIGPLDLKTVVEIPLWTKKHDSLAITISNITEFFDELCLHDQTTWDTLAEKYKYAVHTLFPEFYDNHLLNCDRIQKLSYKFDTELCPYTKGSIQEKRAKYAFGVNPKYTTSSSSEDF